MTYINLHDYARAAQEILSDMAYSYYAGASADKVTLRENRAAFDRIKLWPRMLVDVSERDLTTTLLGQEISFPAIIAPHRFSRPRPS